MLFNSVNYLILLSATFCLYWLSSSILLRQIFLFIACVAFYITWSPILVWLLLGMVTFHWLFMLHFYESSKKAVITLLTVGSLTILGYFKYTNFLISILNQIFVQLSYDWSISKQSIVLPLGISFYTFQIMAYSIDVHRKRIKPEKNLFHLALFIMFFPQLIAGPICRTTELMPQLKQKMKFLPENLIDGIFIFMTGMFLKSAIADNIAPYVNVVFSAPSKYSGYDNLLGAIGFGIQIYGDFCGYSLMAVGAALLFGYSIPFNFNTPYLATTIQDFWRRWHLTLSSWLKDYLYISLGGNRGSSLMTYRNLFLTMVLGGLWHGANWTFIVWGIIHGSALGLERWFLNLKFIPKKTNFGKAIGYLWTMTVVFVAWIYFRANNVSVANEVLLKIAHVDGWFQSGIDAFFYEICFLFLVFHTPLHRLTFNKKISQRSLTTNLIMFPVLALLCIIYYANSEDFIYFQF